MIIGNRKMDDSIIISMDYNLAGRVHQVKFLGDVVDHKFNWKSHIKYVNQKLSHGLLNKVKMA